MKNGEPDFSLREEPEQEEVSDTRRVYIAFNQLVTNNNLTTEERYAYRRDIFTLLPDTDWTEFGQMGTAEYPSDSIFALMDWLQRQDTYTESEIFWIKQALWQKESTVPMRNLTTACSPASFSMIPSASSAISPMTWTVRRIGGSILSLARPLTVSGILRSWPPP